MYMHACVDSYSRITVIVPEERLLEMAEERELLELEELAGEIGGVPAFW